MPEKIILLVEDNPADVTLTIRAMKRANIANEMYLFRDTLVKLINAKALEYQDLISA